MRPAIVLVTILQGFPLSMAAPRATDEILSALQTRLEDNASFEDLVEQLGELEPRELVRLQSEYDKVWPRLRDDYLKAFQSEAKGQNSGPNRQARQGAIRAARETFHTVRSMPEGPMKEAVKKRSEPAVAQLRELLLPSVDRILGTAGEAFGKQREQILRLGEFRDGILKAAVAIEDATTVARVRLEEQKMASELSDLDREGLRIMEKNRKIAESETIPESERRGIEELNEIRLLVGLNALILDPELCEASRDHSQDMATLKFFSHTSPVEGKQSFGQRAARAGTTSSGENIYMGSTNPKSANRGWFHSPGHHKNMFNPAQRRIGLGNYGRHWTQMFGR